MIDQGNLAMVSRELLDRGIRMLQGFRLAETDREHIEELLWYMQPAHNSVWADIGCGFGEPAKLMNEIRPDLTFHLINNNEFQLNEVPKSMAAYYADMHHLPLNNRSMDGAMFLYSICHADNINVVLEEAHRVTKPGGKLFVFDYLRTQGDDYISWQTLHARFFGFNAMEHVCRAAGWRFSGCVAPEGSDEVFRSVFFDQKLYDRIFDDLTPVVWWAKRV